MKKIGNFKLIKNFNFMNFSSPVYIWYRKTIILINTFINCFFYYIFGRVYYFYLFPEFLYLFFQIYLPKSLDIVALFY